MIVEHAGVKGMHWGVRKSAPASSGDAKRAAKLKAKPLSSLTNKQLKEVNARLNLETNYKRMAPSSIAKGKHTAEAILATVGIGVAAYNLVHSPAGKAVIKMGKKVIAKKIKTDPFGAIPKFP